MMFRQHGKNSADGPSLGIHVIAASQTLDKGTVLKPDSFGFRICYSVSEEDSRLALDNDVAAKMTYIPSHPRAIFKEKASGYKEYDKFKPYASPTSQQLHDAIDRVRARLLIPGEGNEHGRS
jgi:hypothetical protein